MSKAIEHDPKPAALRGGCCEGCAQKGRGKRLCAEYLFFIRDTQELKSYQRCNLSHKLLLKDDIA